MKKMTNDMTYLLEASKSRGAEAVHEIAQQVLNHFADDLIEQIGTIFDDVDFLVMEINRTDATVTVVSGDDEIDILAEAMINVMLTEMAKSTMQRIEDDMRNSDN